MSERPLPKTLQAFLAKHPDQFDEGWSEMDGFNDKGDWAHWVYLKAGWHNGDRGSHIIHECTVKEVKAAWGLIRSCDCDECEKAKRENRTSL